MKATLIDWMGTDLSVVNAAKVSFGKRSEWEYPFEDADESLRRLSKRDKSLIQFLARGCTSGDWDILKHTFVDCDSRFSEEVEHWMNYIRRMPSHWSPFAHTAISLHLKMPIFVARQIMKHTTGIEYNEVSRRYVDGKVEFYVPDVWREKADNVKQGSSDEAVYYLERHGLYEPVTELYDYFLSGASTLYDDMLKAGVAPEQARMILPQSMYTEVIATGNLWAICNLITQRTDSHAQKETQDLAKQIEAIVRPLFPVSTDAILGGKS